MFVNFKPELNEFNSTFMSLIDASVKSFLSNGKFPIKSQRNYFLYMYNGDIPGDVKYLPVNVWKELVTRNSQQPKRVLGKVHNGH